MILGARCQQMLDNKMQCANPAEKGSDFCLLHNQMQEQKVANEQNNNTAAKPSSENENVNAYKD
jgi:hypothetical protein